MNPQYVIFVSGLTSEISHESQINAFKKGYKEDNFVSFRYTEINNINNFIKNNVVEAVILFSKACSLAQQVNIDKSKIYCVEPYNCNVDKRRYEGIPAKNMFIHYKACARGKGAKEGANDTSSSKSHITALTDSVIKIFKGNSSTPPPSSSSNQTTISGKITDDKGQPVVGATVKIDPPKPTKLSDPILNTTTGKYEVKDENGNVIADSVDKEVARRKASNKVNANTVTTTSSTTTDPTSSSQEYIDGCPKSCDPKEVFSTIPSSFDSLHETLTKKLKTCSAGCPPEDLYEVFKKSGTVKIKGYSNYTVFEWFYNRISYIRDYSKKYNKYIKDKEDLIAKGEPYNPLTDPNLEEHHLYYTKDPILYADLSIPENKTYVLNVLENYDEPAIWMNEILNIYQAPWYFDYGPNKPTQIVKRPSTSDNNTVTVTDKDGNFTLKPDVWDSTGTVTVSKEGHEVREITNIQQTGGDIIGEAGKQYDIPRFTIPQTPDPTATATSKINQEILTEETNLIKQQGNSELSAQERLANSANNKKEELKKTIIPFVIKLLAPFGAIALQAIISKIPLDKILDQIQCPTQAKLLELINKRNKLVRQINNIYKTINTLSKALSITSTVITAIQAGITLIEALPYPATGIPPIGLPPLTSGIIEITGTGKDKLKEALKKANVIISIVTLSLAAFGVVLGIVLRLLNSLDILIQQCVQEQDVPFEAINNELNTFVNQSTGISNSDVIQSTQNDDTYKGFTLEIKLDKASTNKYPRRFAQALTKQGVPVLKTDSSFASDPQVLLDQLKFIIDSNPQLTAE